MFPYEIAHFGKKVGVRMVATALSYMTPIVRPAIASMGEKLQIPTRCRMQTATCKITQICSYTETTRNGLIPRRNSCASYTTNPAPGRIFIDTPTARGLAPPPQPAGRRNAQTSDVSIDSEDLEASTVILSDTRLAQQDLAS